MKMRLLILFAMAAGCLSGCVERAMVITSEPSGAEVTVNQQWKGTTPYVLPFKHYGVYDIWIEHPGIEEDGKMIKYYPLHVGEPLRAPKYQYPGTDFVSEVLLPTTLRDKQILHYTLERVADADELDDVLDRAVQLREASRARTRMRYEKDESMGRTPGERSSGGGAGSALLRRRGGEQQDGDDDEVPVRSTVQPYVDWDATPPLPSEMPVFMDSGR